MRFGKKTGYVAVTVGFDQVAVVRMVVGMDKQCAGGQRVFCVEVLKGGQVKIHDHVAIEDHKAIFQTSLKQFQTAGGAERKRFNNVMYFNAEFRTVAEVVADDAGQMSGKNEHFVNAVSFGQFNLTFEQRLPGNGTHRFGNIGQAEAGSFAAG